MQLKFTLFTVKKKFQEESLEANTIIYMPSPPPSLSCRTVQYINHSFINSENSSLVNCLGKFNLKRRLLKEKDIIKLQGFLCSLLVREGWAVGTCAALLCSALLHVREVIQPCLKHSVT